MSKNNIINQAPQNIPNDPDYIAWVKDLSRRYMQSQVRAAMGINAEQLKYYWSVGCDIVNMHIEDRWGQGVLKQLTQVSQAHLS